MSTTLPERARKDSDGAIEVQTQAMCSHPLSSPDVVCGVMRVGTSDGVKLLSLVPAPVWLREHQLSEPNPIDGMALGGLLTMSTRMAREPSRP